MASFNDDQGGYVIGVILVVIGSLCLLALFVLLYFNIYNVFDNDRTLHFICDILLLGLGVALIVMGLLLIHFTVIMNILKNYSINVNNYKFDDNALKNVKVYKINKNMSICLRFHQTDKNKYQPSRLFIHYYARIIRGGYRKVYEGTSSAGLMQALMQYNVCNVWTWPYNTLISQQNHQ